MDQEISPGFNFFNISTLSVDSLYYNVLILIQTVDILYYIVLIVLQEKKARRVKS